MDEELAATTLIFQPTRACSRLQNTPIQPNVRRLLTAGSAALYWHSGDTALEPHSGYWKEASGPRGDSRPSCDAAYGRLQGCSLRAPLGCAAAVCHACYLPQCSRDPAPRKSPNTCRTQTSPSGTVETGDHWEPGAALGTHRCAAQRGLSYVSDFVDARHLRSKARTVSVHAQLACANTACWPWEAVPHNHSSPHLIPERLVCAIQRACTGGPAQCCLSPVPLCHNTLRAATRALLLQSSTHLWKRQAPLQRWPLSPPGLRTCCPLCASPSTGQGNHSATRRLLKDHLLNTARALWS